jgi:hypothetical protein
VIRLDLLLSSDAGPEIVRALEAALAGEMSEALRNYQESRAARERTLRLKAASGWVVYKTSAARRDGLGVSALVIGRSQIDPLPFSAVFPSIPGGSQPVVELQAATVLDATIEADRRWPMPDWWLRIDAEGSR